MHVNIAGFFFFRFFFTSFSASVFPSEIDSEPLCVNCTALLHSYGKMFFGFVMCTYIIMGCCFFSIQSTFLE